MAVRKLTTGDDDLIGTSKDDLFLGDWTQTGGTDSLQGLGGDDVFELQGEFFGSIDGGDGDDTVLTAYIGPNVEFTDVERLRTTSVHVDAEATALMSFSIIDTAVADTTYIRFWLTGQGATLNFADMMADDLAVEVNGQYLTSGLTVVLTGRDDRLDGTVYDDVIYGGDGDDYINSLSGNDFVYGEAGNDFLSLGSGEGFFQTIDAGEGDDVIGVYTGAGLVDGGVGNDTVLGSDIRQATFVDVEILSTYVLRAEIAQLNNFTELQYTYGGAANLQLFFSGVGDSMDFSLNVADGIGVTTYDDGLTSAIDLTGTAQSDALYGSQFDDTLRGRGGDDGLYGEAGNDTLIGDSGVDYLYGGAGNDIYYIYDFADEVTEWAGEGVDTIYVGFTYKLSDNQDIEILRASSPSTVKALNLTGNSIGNTLVGNAGANILDGVAGADTMRGLAGDDVYHVDQAGDVVIEAAGQGNDRVLAASTYTLALGSSVEILSTTLTSGSAAINLNGNELSNTIVGNAGANVINGRGGADILRGFGGDDQYYVDDSADIVLETANAGFDRVLSSTSYVLQKGVHVEMLSTTQTAGTDYVTLSGNEFAQTIVGNRGENILQGGGGSDTLMPGNDNERDFILFDPVSDSTGSSRDVIMGLDLEEDDKLYFVGLPVGSVNLAGGLLNEGASFDADIAAAVNAVLDPGGAVLFDPTGGALNIAGHAYVVVDANNDGNYTAGADYLVQLINHSGILDQSDFWY